MKIVIRDDEKKDKAVSAIIGTILIVAITVVLAATLYAVLGGFSGLIGKPTPTASMTVSSSAVGTSGETYTLTFASVSSNLSLSNTALKVSYDGVTVTWGYSSDSTYTYAGYNLTGASAGDPPTAGFYATVNAGPTGGYLTYLTTITIKITTGAAGTPPLTSVSLIDTSSSGVVASQSNL